VQRVPDRVSADMDACPLCGGRRAGPGTEEHGTEVNEFETVDRKVVSMKVLVTGATGTWEPAEGIPSARWTRAAPARQGGERRRVRAGLSSDAYEVVVGDIFETNTCLHACDGCEAVVHLVGSYVSFPRRDHVRRSSPRGDLQHRRRGPTRPCDALHPHERPRDARRRRFVYIGPNAPPNDREARACSGRSSDRRGSLTRRRNDPRDQGPRS